ncbi:MAG: 5-oxoprolinase subunit PxpA [Nocardioidaceae bacterium]
MSAVDLNADLGEGVTDDPGLLAVVTSANVACGSHAGDVATMTAVCGEAARRGVAVGAQVSYDDRASFGRARLDVEHAVLRDQVADQVFLLDRIARHAGLRVTYVKPHGALYNRVVDDEDHARAVLDGSGDLPVLGLPGSVLLDLAAAAGREVRREGFPDRGYTDGGWSGRLLPRDQEGALVGDPDEVARRAVAMARSGDVDSVCVHGDSPGAVATARAVRAALEADGIEVRAVHR